MGSSLCKRLLLCLLIALFSCQVAWAGEKKPEILFIPQDNRPISSQQTAEVIESLGYKVMMPPEESLGNRYEVADREALFNWLEQQGKNNKIAVLASDALIYGGLVNSRKHHYSLEELNKNLARLVKIHEKYPNMPIYVFSSIMRTPRNDKASGTEDAEYYKQYGSFIAQYTSIDGADTSALIKPYQVMLRQEGVISALRDWQNRRQINYAVNEKLIDLTKQGVIKFLLIGRDDNDTGSATDQESEQLQAYAKSLGLKNNQVRIMAGIDELALIMLTKIVNQAYQVSPQVYVEYAMGYGPATVPTYSNEDIDSSITDEIYTMGGKRALEPQGADLIFLVNTTQSGWTYDANTPVNSTKLRFNSLDFLQRIAYYLNHNQKIIIGDIAFANGSDNALMVRLAKYQVLDRLYGYAGWNTATNSTGFALGMGMVSLHLQPEQRKNILATRYLDDWLYQANVRQDVNAYLSLLTGKGDYLEVADKLNPAEEYGTHRLNLLKNYYLANFALPKSINLRLKWNRIFEGDFAKEDRQQFTWPH